MNYPDAQGRKRGEISFIWPGLLAGAFSILSFFGLLHLVLMMSLRSCGFGGMLPLAVDHGVEIVLLSDAVVSLVLPYVVIMWAFRRFCEIKGRFGFPIAAMLFFVSLPVTVFFWLAYENNADSGLSESTTAGKPVIYLYPTEKTDVSVKLDYQGRIIADYPKYDYNEKGWSVTAFPDGRIVNKADDQEYSYLFWEGISGKKIDFDMTQGFVVKGEDSREFLQQKLSEIGLTPKEYNEFIVYWYPKLKDSPYNLIHFSRGEYEETAPLAIDPRPDSMLRVFMAYEPLKNPVQVDPQKFDHFERRGFSVVEWGGAEIGN